MFGGHKTSLRFVCVFGTEGVAILFRNPEQIPIHNSPSVFLEPELKLEQKKIQSTNRSKRISVRNTRDITSQYYYALISILHCVFINDRIAHGLFFFFLHRQRVRTPS